MRVRDPFNVDQDVPAAVRERLGHLLERRLEEAGATDPVFAADIADRVARFALTGGRRLRAAFLWWAMRGCGGGAPEAPRALGVAAALELIQTCALIHDDVMDGSTLRRGRPALHVGIDDQYGTAGRASPCGTFGGAAAVLAGDLALAWADDEFAEAVRGAPAEGRAADTWRVMRTEMVAGQYLDLHGQITNATSAARAVRSAVLKTSRYTVAHPLALGAVLAGASEATERRLRAAGRSAGLAFQLHDDLRGAFGDPAATGKPVGEDLREGKATYLLAVARDLCVRDRDQAGLRLLDEVVGSPCARPEDVARVLELLDTRGARELVSRRVRELCDRGVDAVRDAGLSRDAADRIGELLRAACGLDTAERRPVPTGPAAVRDTVDPVLIGEAR
ncbi:polyprenyl synthetase family protein [Streptomyces globisporus]|uniref:polyprenyl synthetase family protein n=1 Tax=Streptomyces globisporus TaxID=1908 RepID=UPI0007C59DB9|nr:polyprenyl synthetase family protein [Streptomyces globisporus]